MVTAALPAVATIWQWLADVVDPEIPVLSIVDLGIVRDVWWEIAGSGAELEDQLVVAITPTYSGCPATEMIARDIRAMLNDHGISNLRLLNRLAPAWTTDWMTEAAKEQVLAYGIVPPHKLVLIDGLAAAPATPVVCPRCRSSATEMVSRFGSTPCKSLYKCTQCREPFDVFKCH